MVNELTSRLSFAKLSEDESAMAYKHKQWEQESGFEFLISKLLQGFKDIYSVTNVPIYHSFKYCVLYRPIVTNVHLKHWGILDNDTCTLCGKDQETYQHFVYLL